MLRLHCVGLLLWLLAAPARPAPAEGAPRPLQLQQVNNTVTRLLLSYLTQAENAVPRMGKKAAAPVEVPSFTSGFLPPSYPRYMLQQRYTKREAARPRLTSWQLGKRSPWTGAWANIVWQPAEIREAAANTKRSAVPNDWNSPWENTIRSPQGFRFTQGSPDWLSRDLLYKGSFIYPSSVIMAIFTST